MSISFVFVVKITAYCFVVVESYAHVLFHQDSGFVSYRRHRTIEYIARNLVDHLLMGYGSMVGNPMDR